MLIRMLQDTPAPAPAPAPPAPPTTQDVDFSYNSQDSVVFPSAPATVHNVTSGDAPSVEKAELQGSTLATQDGKYVFPDGDARNVAAISFSAVAKTIEMMSSGLGQPIGWAFQQPKLGVVADAGEDFNAYYARDSANVNFFHGTDPKTSQVVYSGASGEVCSHETGHAVLDGLRPGYFSSWTPDVGAFHESFGDQMGMLMSLQDDRTLDKIVEQCGGDLSKPNCLAWTGEQLGVAINDYLGQNATGGDYVRNAINDFKWADPSTLPDSGDPNQLGSEVHSFSRLWSGAFYDILNAVNQENLAAGQDPKTALRNTGNEMLALECDLLKNAPQGDFTYRDMANAWIDAENKAGNSKRADLIKTVMTNRNILGDQPAPPPAPPTPDPTPDPDPNPPDGGDGSKNIFTSTEAGRKPLSDVTRQVRVRLSGPQFGMFNGAVVDTVVDKDGSLAKDAEVQNRTRSNVARLIAQGRVKYMDPGAKRPGPKDLFDAQGRPYIGFVRWEDGQMVLERAKIAT